MTNVEFLNEIGRLKARFGERGLDQEFLRLVFKEVSSMSASDWVGGVDFLIGTKPASRSPLLEDFRNLRIEAEKRKISTDVASAGKILSGKWPSGLQAVLAKEYPGCKTVWEAVEVQILRNKIKAS